ncbi:sugar phosphate isomerase/epimerase family protein [Okibacterium endophyticum]
MPLDEALDTISELGFTAIDLGALPGVCDHVPYELDREAVGDVAAVVKASKLRVRSINADVGDLNVPLSAVGAAERSRHVDRLIELCVATGAHALVLPNGRSSHTPNDDLDADLHRVVGELTWIAERAARHSLELWVEAPHFFRLCFDLDRTRALLELLPPQIGVVCDVSHITASGATPREFLALAGQRTRHVHLRDAEPGHIHHSIGNGVVDFEDLVAALAEHRYTGALALELETRDVADDQRPAAAQAAGEYISGLLGSVASAPLSHHTER